MENQTNAAVFVQRAHSQIDQRVPKQPKRYEDIHQDIPLMGNYGGENKSCFPPPPPYQEIEIPIEPVAETT
ncbi:hypothetical protein MXB_476 [Myxobolus squamalis]|nr:hypothetical protein MXB_476 [Myxobolus squamalis]